MKYYVETRIIQNRIILFWIIHIEWEFTVKYDQVITSAFFALSMQEAFYYVPRLVIWWKLRSNEVPEAYIDIIRVMYLYPDSVIWTAIGDKKPFSITVAVHQGAVLSPILFSVMHTFR